MPALRAGTHACLSSFVLAAVLLAAALAAERCSSFVMLAAAIQKWRRSVIVLWAVMAASMLYPATLLFDVAETNLSPAEDAPSIVAADFIAQVAHNHSHATDVCSAIILVRSKVGKGTSLVSDETFAGMDQLVRRIDGAVARAAAGVVEVYSIDGYYQWRREGVPKIGCAAYASDDERALSVVVTVDGSHTNCEVQVTFEDVLQEDIDGNVSLRRAEGVGDLSVTVISNAVMIHDSIARAGVDIPIADAVSLPLAFLVVGLFIRSRLLLIELAMLPFVGLVSFGLAALVPVYADVAVPMQAAGPSAWTECPVVDVSVAVTGHRARQVLVESALVFARTMSSLVIAISLDYFLFLITRFREACVRTGGADANFAEAVGYALTGAGFTVLVSGATLVVSSLSMVAVVPIDFLRGQAFTTAIGAAVAVSAHLTLFPAMLLCLPAFVARAATSGARTLTESTSLLSPGKAPPADASPPTEPTSSTAPSISPHFSPFWYRFASALTQPPGQLLAIAGVLLLSAPFAYFCYEFRISYSLETSVGVVTPLMEEYKVLDTGFAAQGKLGLYSSTLGIAATPGTEVLSEEFFNASRVAARAVAGGVPGLCVDVVGLSLACSCDPQGRASCMDMPLSNTQYCLSEEGRSKSSSEALDEACAGVRKQAQMLLGDGALLFSMQPVFDPNSLDGLRWYEAALAQAQTADVPLVSQLHLAGQAAKQWDVYMSGKVGFGFLVYAHGALAWTHAPPFARLGAVNWLILWWAFPIVWGLALDYDIFVLVRVREQWLAGHDTREAIRRGTALSGGVVTAAGCVMAVSFGGLLFASQPVAFSGGLVVVAAVVYDTFVMRTILVPALFSLWPDSNWWPGSICTPRRGPHDER